MRPGRGGEIILPCAPAEYDQRQSAECHRRAEKSAESAPIASAEQCHRDEESEMRLVAERPKTDPGKDRPAVDPQRADAEQCRGQKRVLPQAARPEGCR